MSLQTWNAYRMCVQNIRQYLQLSFKVRIAEQDKQACVYMYVCSSYYNETLNSVTKRWENLGVSS